MSDKHKDDEAGGHGHGNQPDFFFDNEPERWPAKEVSGQELRDKFSVPPNVQIFQKIPGHKDREILNNTVVDLRGKGPERFFTQAVGSGAGLEVATVQLLLDEDYVALSERGLVWEEDAQKRFLIFRRYPLPAGVFTVTEVDVLVQIPANYPRDGNDMLWVSPRLDRTDGKQVPAQSERGSDSNLHHGGVEFCRWSRHWQETHNRWRDGVDDALTIVRRLDWAFAHPDPAVA
jgi:Prokaryotic E2 family E/Multiubiquitin